MAFDEAHSLRTAYTSFSAARVQEAEALLLLLSGAERVVLMTATPLFTNLTAFTTLLGIIHELLTFREGAKSQHDNTPTGKVAFTLRTEKLSEGSEQPQYKSRQNELVTELQKTVLERMTTQYGEKAFELKGEDPNKVVAHAYGLSQHPLEEVKSDNATAIVHIHLGPDLEANRVINQLVSKQTIINIQLNYIEPAITSAPKPTTGKRQRGQELPASGNSPDDSLSRSQAQAVEALTLHDPNASGTQSKKMDKAVEKMIAHWKNYPRAVFIIPRKTQGSMPNFNPVEQLLLQLFRQWGEQNGKLEVLVHNTFRDLVKENKVRALQSKLTISKESPNGSTAENDFQKSSGYIYDLYIGPEAIGEGLDLAAAKQIHIMAPLASPSDEQQAIGRVYRPASSVPGSTEYRAFVYSAILAQTLRAV